MRRGRREEGGGERRGRGTEEGERMGQVICDSGGGGAGGKEGEREGGRDDGGGDL